MTLVALGALVLLLIVADLLWTTLAPAAGGGPLTTWIGRAAWRAATRRPRHRRLQLIGYGILLAVLATWVGGTWLGWALVFHGSTGAVVDAASGEPASSIGRVAFAAGGITGAGAGYTAGSGAWQLANNMAALLGLAEFTLAITYLFQVVTATAHKRAVAQAITGLGDSPWAMVAAGRGDASLGAVGQQLSNLTVDLALVARQHRSLPVLHYLHAPVGGAAVEVAIARLDEAMAIARCCDVSVGLTQPLRRIIVDYLDSVPVRVDAAAPPPPDIPVAEVAGCVGEAVENDGPHRARLHGLVVQNAWEWIDVDGRRTG